MIRVNDIKLPLGASESELKKRAAKALFIPESSVLTLTLRTKSVDSRRKDDIHFSCSVVITTDLDEEKILINIPKNKAMLTEEYKYTPPEVYRTSHFRPVVAGFGPAGMFCALTLAKAGLRPIVLERGDAVDERAQKVNVFFNKRILDENSNVQFGEGGAGTFSDGKLTTGIKDARCREVFLRFAEFGAPDDILYSGTPHIGTDRLKSVVKNLRNEVIRLGGEVLFRSTLTGLITANGFVQGVTYRDANGSEHDIETDCAVIAIGHSARDTFEMLNERGLELTQKPFSVGTRIEHPQEYINKLQYGKEYKNPILPPADYKLSNHPLHGRGLYTFCMCPGGTVVAATSEKGCVAVNGMSEYLRDGENANSALLVGINPEDFPSEHPLAGIELQRDIERKAFSAGESSYMAPAQLLGDFLNGIKSEKLGGVRPSCPTGVVPGDVRNVLPDKVIATLKDGLCSFDRMMPGFLLRDAVLTFPETRSSSPVRINRSDYFEATRLRGLYPCGEGAGYAGGIVSAAVDGIKAAEAIMTDRKA